MTTKIISKLAPKNDGYFPTHSDIYGEGGFQVRTNITDRNNIPELNRKEGMWVNVLSENTIYTLGNGLTDGYWVAVTLGSDNAIIFDGGTSPDNIRSDKPTFQSPIDNTKVGIVNFGSNAENPGIGTTGNYSAILSGDSHSVDGDWSAIVSGNSHVIDNASCNSVICGGDLNKIHGNYNVIGGGTGNETTGIYATVSGGSNNTINAQFTTIGGGSGNAVSGDFSTIGGGVLNIADGYASAISGGSSNTASGSGSVVNGGNLNNAIGNYSVAEGVRTVANLTGQYASSGSRFGGTPGDSQYTRVTYNGTSTSGNPVVLAASGIDGSFYTFVNNKTCTMRVTIVASEAALVNSAAFIYDLLVSTNAGVSTIVAGPTLGFSSNVPSYTVSITIDGITTNQLNITFTGISATARAVATIEATELIFV